MDNLVNSNMKHGEVPESYFMEKTLARSELEKIGKPISDRRFYDSGVKGFHCGVEGHQDDDVLKSHV